MSKPWTFGLCDCFGDCNACLCGCCCPWCAGGEISEKIGENWLQGFIFTSICGILHPCFVTAPLREKFQIEGGCFMDTVHCCCCGPCQLVRELREARNGNPK